MHFEWCSIFTIELIFTIISEFLIIRLLFIIITKFFFYIYTIFTIIDYFFKFTIITKFFLWKIQYRNERNECFTKQYRIKSKRTKWHKKESSQLLTPFITSTTYAKRAELLPDNHRVNSENNNAIEKTTYMTGASQPD